MTYQQLRQFLKK